MFIFFIISMSWARLDFISFNSLLVSLSTGTAWLLLSTARTWRGGVNAHELVPLLRRTLVFKPAWIASLRVTGWARKIPALMSESSIASEKWHLARRSRDSVFNSGYARHDMSRIAWPSSCRDSLGCLLLILYSSKRKFSAWSPDLKRRSRWYTNSEYVRIRPAGILFNTFRAGPFKRVARNCPASTSFQQFSCIYTLQNVIRPWNLASKFVRDDVLVGDICHRAPASKQMPP